MAGTVLVTSLMESEVLRQTQQKTYVSSDVYLVL